MRFWTPAPKPADERQRKQEGKDEQERARLRHETGCPGQESIGANIRRHIDGKVTRAEKIGGGAEIVGNGVQSGAGAVTCLRGAERSAAQ